MGNSNSKNRGWLRLPTNSIKIEVVDLETNISTMFHSANAAARALNISQPAITTYFRNNQKKPIKGRYVIRKI
jgi:hypothetical protein